MQTVISAFDTREDAQRALDRLVESGFGREAVHLQSGYEAGDSTGIDRARDDADDGFFHSISRFFSELFCDDDSDGESGRYAEAIRRGGTVMLVDAADQSEAERARSILAACDGSIDLQEGSALWQREGSAVSEPQARARPDDESVVPVLQEELKVGKREVPGGAVRVVRRVRETPVREMVRLHEERITVQRRPVDRPASEADFANFQEGTLEMREMREEPVVSKTARVVEEVVIEQSDQERTQTIEDTVRRTDVEVERVEANASGASTRGAGTAEATAVTGAQQRSTRPGTTGTPPAGSAGSASEGNASRRVDARVDEDSGEPIDRSR